MIVLACSFVLASSSETIPALEEGNFVSAAPCQRITNVMAMVPIKKMSNSRLLRWVSELIASKLIVLLLYKFPVENIPPGANIIGTAVLVFEIVGMFPYI